MQPKPQKYWFTLVDSEGQSFYDPNQRQCIELMPDDAVTAVFLERVKLQCAEHLPHIDACQLQVFRNQPEFESYQKKTPIESWIDAQVKISEPMPEQQTLVDIGTWKRADTLWVVVPKIQGSMAMLRSLLVTMLGPLRDDLDRLKTHPYDTMQSSDTAFVPLINGKPELLLFNLSKPVGEYEWPVWKTFLTDGKELLFNVSGSGKTRLVFEMLARHWGFYYICKNDGNQHKLGSNDFRTANAIAERTMPHADTAVLGWPELTDRFKAASTIMMILFLTRLATMEYVREIHGYGPLDWLHLQTIGLSQQQQEHRDILNDIYKAVMRRVFSIKERYIYAWARFAVIDDAHVALDYMKDCFPRAQHVEMRSESMWAERSLLTVAVYTFPDVVQRGYPIIVGTSDQLEWTTDRNLRSHSSFRNLQPYIVLQGYEDFDAFCSCVKSVFSLDRCATKALTIGFEYLRGRAGFTASFLKCLLENRQAENVDGPLTAAEVHQAVNTTIAYYLRGSATCESLVECIEKQANAEDLLEQEFPEPTISFRNLIMNYYRSQKPHHFATVGQHRHLQLVEMGIARFVVDPLWDQKCFISIDEPLVFLAAYREYEPLKLLLAPVEDQVEPVFQFEDVIAEWLMKKWLKNGASLNELFSLFVHSHGRESLAVLPDWLRNDPMCLHMMPHLLHLRQATSINEFVEEVFAGQNTSAFLKPSEVHLVDRYAAMRVGNRFVSLSLQAKFLQEDLKPTQYKTMRQRVDDTNLYDLARVHADQFSAHIGIIVVYGAQASQLPQVQVSMVQQKPVVQLTIDARTPEFFAGIAEGLENAKQFAQTRQDINKFLADWAIYWRYAHERNTEKIVDDEDNKAMFIDAPKKRKR